MVTQCLSHRLQSLPRLQHLVSGLRNWLHAKQAQDRPRKCCKKRNERPLCQNLLEIQDRPLLVLSPDYLISRPFTFELVPQDNRPGSFIAFAGCVKRIAIQLRYRDRLLHTAIREIWMPNGQRRIAFAYRKCFLGKTWTMHLSNGDCIGQLTRVAGEFLAALSVDEMICIKSGCSCGRPCFNILRGSSTEHGRVIASVVPKADGAGFMVIVAPFVDVVAMLLISSIVWKI